MRLIAVISVARAGELVLLRCCRRRLVLALKGPLCLERLALRGRQGLDWHALKCSGTRAFLQVFQGLLQLDLERLSLLVNL